MSFRFIYFAFVLNLLFLNIEGQFNNDSSPLIGRIFTFVGSFQTNVGDNLPGLEAPINQPTGLEFDANGNLFISDSGANRIRFWNQTSLILTTLVGNGLVSYTQEGFLGNATSVNRPAGLSFLQTRNLLFYCDSLNHQVRSFNLTSRIVRNVAGDTNPSDQGIGNNALQASLHQPTGLAFSSSRNWLLICETRNNRVTYVDLNNNTLQLLIGQEGNFLFPQFIFLDQNQENLLIADYFNNELKKFNLNTRVLITGIGRETNFSSPPENSPLSLPAGASFDIDGSILVADSKSNIVRRIFENNQTMIRIAGQLFNNGYNGESLLARNALVSELQFVISDSLGRIYLSDTGNNRVRRINSDLINTIVGNGRTSLLINNIPPTSIVLNQPSKIIQDSIGNFYIADTFNFVVRKIDQRTGRVNVIAGNGDNLFQSSIQNGPALNTPLGQIFSLSLDETRQILYISQFSKIVKLDLNTSILNDFTLPTFGHLQDIHYSPKYEKIFACVSIQDSVIALQANSTNLDQPFEIIAGNGTRGFFGDQGLAVNALLSLPNYLVLDEANDLLFFSDSNNQRIRMVNLTNGIIETVVGGGNQTIDPINGTNSLLIELNNPVGLALNGLKRILYFTSTNDQIILKMNLTSFWVNAIAGSFLDFGFSGDGGFRFGSVRFGSSKRL